MSNDDTHESTDVPSDMPFVSRKVTGDRAIHNAPDIDLAPLFGDITVHAEGSVTTRSKE